MQRLTWVLATRPDVQSSQPRDDRARRLANILYSNVVAALTFGAFSAFRHDIIWRLTLIRRHKLPVTPRDEQVLFAMVADAMSAELPEHAETVYALFAHMTQMIATIRAEELPAIAHQG